VPLVGNRETTAASASDGPARTTAALAPFVPRLTVEWLRGHPEVNWLEIEGTLAFIDISGFTTMSERLSSRGRVGAEEVTEVMNATFAALLAVAYAGGGGLLKFGGDALLLLYEGEDHAGRAARAAFDMRRTLRAIGRPRTSAGAVQLKMHAGLHAGRFQFFLVGESHRELLVTGPAASRTVEMEAASEAGEILLSPETADLLSTETLGEEKGPGRLLRAAPEARREDAPLPDVDGIPLEVAVPAPLRAQLLQVGPLEGEHRNAAIAFIRFAGIDNVIATEGPEAAAEALDVLVRTVQSAADDHKVTFLESDVDRDGGRIVLVSGAPQTFGDDEERLLRTVRAVVNAGLPLPVHVGVNQGRVFAGQVGAPFRRTYTVLGDTAALAARLMARAKEDEIWVAKNAFIRGGTRFAAVELEPFHVKGKSEPVRAVMLGELAETARPEADSEEKLPFVDRERERAVLAASVAPVRMGFGTLVELVGDPGIGKSRLADELRENCADMQFVTMRCEQYESSTPYYPFRPFLRSLLDVELNGGGEHNRAVLSERLGTLDGELVPWAPLLAAPLDVDVEATPEVDDLDPAFWRARLHGVMGNLLGRLLDSPTLILFEDVHWMDDASSELLRYLGTQLSTRPWLTCTTRRPVEGGFAAAEGTPPLPALTLRLEPLPAEDAKELVQAAAGGRRLTDGELAALMERGAGNPLFLQELASPEESAAGEGEKLPDTVEALVATRIDRLAPGDRALLRWASVVGVSFPGAVIADVLEGDPTAASDSEAWDRLAEFVERDPNVPGGFRFRHALIRDGAYEGLSYKRRRDLHGRVAEVIEQRQGERPEDAAELLSLHFHRAERWPEAWRYSVDAGRRAKEKYANVEAASFFERALEAARQTEVPRAELYEVASALGDVRLLLGQYEDATAAYGIARKHVDTEDPCSEARLVIKQMDVPLRLRKYPRVLRLLTRGLQLLEGVEGQAAAAVRAELCAWYGRTRILQHRPADAIEWAHRAIAEAQAAGGAADEALGRAYLVLDLGDVGLGRASAEPYAERALEIFERIGYLRGVSATLDQLAARAYLSGRWDECLELAQRSRDVDEKIGDSYSAAISNLNIGETLADQGRPEEAEPIAQEALHVWKAPGADSGTIAAEAMRLLGYVLAQLGRFDEAIALLEESRDVFREAGDRSEELEAELRIAQCLLLRGDADAALEWASTAVAEVDKSRNPTLAAALHRVRGLALIEIGQLEDAAEAFEQSLAVARSAEPDESIKSAEYELGLTFDALDRLAQLTGRRDDDYAARRDAILVGWGVVAVPDARCSLPGYPGRAGRRTGEAKGQERRGAPAGAPRRSNGALNG
jgi:class 3 adenylate cyclase/tetratricopeptide (TPR) repeat protein